MITNENKVPLKDMLPIEIQEVINTDIIELETFMHKFEGEEFMHTSAWQPLNCGEAIFSTSIYRQKPKVLSPRELHIEVANMSESSGQRIDKAGVMKLIKRLEGYKDD